MGSTNTFKSIYHDMISPSLLIKGLSLFMSHLDMGLLKTLLSLRQDMLYSTFFHANKPETLISLARYWQTQIFFLEKNHSKMMNLHPLIEQLDRLLKQKESSRSWCVKALQHLVYEIDSQGMNWGMQSQRNRMLFHLSKIWEIVSPELSQEDILWCQQVIIYQFRGLCDHCFALDLSVYEMLKKDLESRQNLRPVKSLASRFFIAYHIVLWKCFLKKSEPTKIDTYERLSSFGTIQTFYAMFAGSLRT